MGIVKEKLLEQEEDFFKWLEACPVRFHGKSTDVGRDGAEVEILFMIEREPQDDDAQKVAEGR
jgi:hypothetical protein